MLKTTSAPAPPPAWLPTPLALADHTAPKVLILDTGLRTAEGAGTEVEHPALTSAKLHSPWLQAAPAGAIDDEDEFDDDGSGTLDFEAGHGTFITGIIQQICPDAEVHIAGVLSSFGDGDVANVIGAFELAVAKAGRFDVVIMSLGGYMSDDDGELFGAALRRLLGDGLGISAAGNQSTSRPYFPAALPDIVAVGGLGAERQGVVHELRRVGRCMCTGHRHRQHVLRRTGREGRRAVHGLGSVEWDELRGAEGGRRHRSRDVPDRGRGGVGLEAPLRLPPLPVPRPRHRVQRLITVPFELHDYRGPLGAIEQQLAQRRIAVAADDAGQLFLVRPDSVVVEFDEHGFEDVQRVIADDSLEVLGGPVTEPPPSGFLATRPGPDARRHETPTRWDTGGLQPLADRFASERCTVRPHQVYLTDGVAQHFRVVTENRPSRRPAQAVPVSTSSTARPAAAPLMLPAPLRLSGHRPPNVLVLDTGLRTRDRRRRPPVAARPLRPAHAVARPADRRALGRRGRARRRPRWTARRAGRPRHVHQRRHPPTVPRRPHPPPGGVDQLRRR